MKRFFLELAYNGQAYCGWQNQPNGTAVQAVIEQAISTILRAEIPVVGCGRTDAGVHASQYFLHFDAPVPVPTNFVYRLNSFLPKDIVIYNLTEVSPEAHARFDAQKRSYVYKITGRRDPFNKGTITEIGQFKSIDFELLQETAQLFLKYDAFFPFCKTNSDAKTMNCKMFKSEWEVFPSEMQIHYHVSANRFLRGMVRLLVGACLNVAQGKLSIAEVKMALEKQERIEKSHSVPADGLFLNEVHFPFLNAKN